MSTERHHQERHVIEDMLYKIDQGTVAHAMYSVAYQLSGISYNLYQISMALQGNDNGKPAPGLIARRTRT